MRHVRVVYPFLTDKEIEAQGLGFKAWLCSDQLSDLGQVSYQSGLSLFSRKWDVSALATTDDNRHKPYKIRNVKSFWLLLKVG